MRVESKCIGCTERYLGCHDKCSDYKDYKEKLQKEKDMRLEVLAKEAPFFEAKRKAKEKARKKHGK